MSAQENPAGSPRPKADRPHEVHVELLDEGMVAVYRQMTPAERVARGLATFGFVRERILAHLRYQHPDWTETQLNQATANRLNGRAD